MVEAAAVIREACPVGRRGSQEVPEPPPMPRSPAPGLRNYHYHIYMCATAAAADTGFGFVAFASQHHYFTHARPGPRLKPCEVAHRA